MMEAKTREWVNGILAIAKAKMMKVLEDLRALPGADVIEKGLVVQWQLCVEDEVVATGKSIYDPGRVEFVMDPNSVNIAHPVAGVVGEDLEVRWQLHVEDKVVADGSFSIEGRDNLAVGEHDKF